MMPEISQEQLQAICNILADTNTGLTKTELTTVLRQVEIETVDDGYKNNGFFYTTGQNKRTWLYNCFVKEINKSHNFTKIYVFIESALNPARYTSNNKRAMFIDLLENVNKVLMLVGLEIQPSGKLQKVVKATTLDEVDRRVKSLKDHLYKRSIHVEVTKYCSSDYLRKDYYDTVFEAAKGVAQRVRDISGLDLDGSKLFQMAFSTKDPYIFLNGLQTDTEISEHNGLKELLEAIFHLIRNPAAHTPKINWQTDETKALDVLSLISFAHKYLDECRKVPRITTKPEGTPTT
ncbi:MAG: TIGR02391 family protein [Treponema sp.]|jgi:uncharacterized protein (TIGR02391 family)|nr:TIGR02391 family protein [Treponema sp.]